MNIKALAAIVGTLSLGALATGCVTPTGSAAPSTEKGAQGSCSATGGEASCGEGSCSGAQKAATPEKGSQGGCGASGCAGGK